MSRMKQRIIFPGSEAVHRWRTAWKQTFRHGASAFHCALVRIGPNVVRAHPRIHFRRLIHSWQTTLDRSGRTPLRDRIREV